MSVEKNPVLLLNKSWFPVRVSTFKEALIKVCNNRAYFVDHENYCLYSWDDWIDIFSFSIEDAYKFNKPIIRGVNFCIKQPEVVVCNVYNKVPVNNLKLTRRNLLIRDNFICQYCGVKVSSREATLDHVKPRSSGGKNRWENLVVSCVDCNVSKGNKTLKEAGLRLKSVPKKPSWSPIYSLIHKKRPKSWDKFIKTDKWNEIGYWDVELKG